MRSLDRSHLGSKMPSAASSLDEVGPRTEVTHFCCAERTGRRRRRGEPTAAAPGNTDAKQLDCSLGGRAGFTGRCCCTSYATGPSARAGRRVAGREGAGCRVEGAPKTQKMRTKLHLFRRSERTRTALRLSRVSDGISASGVTGTGSLEFHESQARPLQRVNGEPRQDC